MWFTAGLVVVLILFLVLIPPINKWADQRRMEKLGFIKVEATIFGGIKSVDKLRNVKSGGHEKRVSSEHYLVLEFPLQDGTVVRVKSERIKKVDFEIGAKLQIAYNPEDARDLYLLDEG